MDINNVPAWLVDDLRERLTDDEIVNASADDLFCEFCEWHGLGSWGSSLIEALDDLRKAELLETKEDS